MIIIIDDNYNHKFILETELKKHYKTLQNINHNLLNFFNSSLINLPITGFALLKYSATLS